ncbi:hypothetical protein SPRG_01812 [Saprolegnia parasitica CBS 223.65]|uniref:Uncharacterized protein n=1 Tax=Saprolegnia parasitica (strain CBS 223.65) TaxID=695850 RepID=A0A067CTT7_SAPPC|nr:hypothetical protein SPRG_01812 [Saprolegnia parasitica CBS 223.65]KDO33933.1 hypothetical protein SPRG_01812 [Saprolegnia parasitica CBS 223.65]|eukprot:XP_012195567.1 hypothetical protein SPRG_01812 [Saprolegnia parasitica CBS 223.65]
MTGTMMGDDRSSYVPKAATAAGPQTYFVELTAFPARRQAPAVARLGHARYGREFCRAQRKPTLPRTRSLSSVASPTKALSYSTTHLSARDDKWRVLGNHLWDEKCKALATELETTLALSGAATCESGGSTRSSLSVSQLGNLDAFVNGYLPAPRLSLSTAPAPACPFRLSPARRASTWRQWRQYPAAKRLPQLLPHVTYDELLQQTSYARALELKLKREREYK